MQETYTTYEVQKEKLAVLNQLEKKINQMKLEIEQEKEGVSSIQEANQTKSMTGEK